MVNTAEIRALIATPDPWLIRNFSSVCGQLGINTHASATDGPPEELGRAKYGAVLIDFDNAPGALPTLVAVRESPVNRNALVFAVATATAHRHQALRRGANFVFERPIDAGEIRRVLYAAYDLMVDESRRYFRCAAELPVLLKRANDEPELRCTTINISANGMAVRTPSSLNPGEVVQITLFLGVEAVVRASGTSVWDDKHGKTGICFQCTLARDQIELDAWLNARFSEMLAPRHALLYKGIAAAESSRTE